MPEQSSDIDWLIAQLIAGRGEAESWHAFDRWSGADPVRQRIARVVRLLAPTARRGDEGSPGVAAAHEHAWHALVATIRANDRCLERKNIGHPPIAEPRRTLSGVVGDEVPHPEDARLFGAHPLRRGLSKGRHVFTLVFRTMVDELTSRAVALIEGRDTQLKAAEIQRLQDLIERTKPESK